MSKMTAPAEESRNKLDEKAEKYNLIEVYSSLPHTMHEISQP